MCYAVYLIEMIIFIPNVKSFSPIWVWRGAEYNNTVRTGNGMQEKSCFGTNSLPYPEISSKRWKGGDESDDIVLYSNYVTT